MSQLRRAAQAAREEMDNRPRKIMTTAQKFHRTVKSIERATGERLTAGELKELAAEMEADRGNYRGKQ